MGNMNENELPMNEKKTNRKYSKCRLNIVVFVTIYLPRKLITVVKNSYVITISQHCVQEKK